MIDEAHARSIRVVLDGVFNHASRGFFQFHDIMENGPNSAYLDWLTSRNFRSTPTTAIRHPTIKRGGACPLCLNSTWLVLRCASSCGESPAGGSSLASMVGGLTFPTRSTTTTSGEFRQRIRAANPDAYIVGEVWTDAERWLKGDMWDAVMNYQFTQSCIAFFIGDSLNEDDLKKTSLYPAGPTTAEAFRRSIEGLVGLYHPNVSSVMLNLLGSHDMARFLTLARGDKTALRLATLFQMIYPGAPSIYYGDEIGMTGGHDPANRSAFPGTSPMAGTGTCCTIFSG